ncbi:hypothetical protein [Neisseria subflava]|nr:hypothetical protein [Neisseria subflava]
MVAPFGVKRRSSTPRGKSPFLNRFADAEQVGNAEEVKFAA